MMLISRNIESLDIDSMEVFVGHSYNNPSSVKWLKYFIQQIDSKKFRLFDYGPTQNQILYKQSEPPEVPISRVIDTGIPIMLVRAL